MPDYWSSDTHLLPVRHEVMIPTQVMLSPISTTQALGWEPQTKGRKIKFKRTQYLDQEHLIACSNLEFVLLIKAMEHFHHSMKPDKMWIKSGKGRKIYALARVMQAEMNSHLQNK